MSIRLGDGTLIAGGAQTFPLLSTMWADHILNDVSWLRADTFSWQSGDVYKSVYEKLVAEYANGTTETEGAITFKRTESGFKITESTQEQAILDLYNRTGVAWYYILDTANRRFKLPRTKYNFVGLRDSVGSYVEESLPNITGEIDNLRSYDANSSLPYTGIKALKATRTAVAQTFYSGTDNASGYKLEFDASWATPTYKDNAPVQQRATQMYLYFYVGNYTQTAIQQTAGLNAELFNGKLDKDSVKAYVIENYDDGNGNGWEKWSDGKLVQHQTASGTFNSNTVFNLLTPFYSDNYFIIGTANSENATLSSSASCMWSCKTKTTETFTGEACRGTTGNKTFFFLTWLAIGKWK